MRLGATRAETRVPMISTSPFAADFTCTINRRYHGPGSPVSRVRLRRAGVQPIRAGRR